MTRLAATAVAALALAASASGGARTGLAGAAPCPDAPGFTCSTLSVPLDRTGKTPGRLVLRIGVRDRGGSLGTLVFLTGGPGQPGVSIASYVTGRIGNLFAGYRLVFFDQRGTGRGALRCRALQRQMGSTDLVVPTKAAVTSCARAIGPRRRFFSTASTVDDLDDLRAALGTDKLVLDGVSYGTLVAERYAIAYPNRVARLVLDSVVPHAGADPFERANAHASARVLRAVCRVRSCAGDPAADLAYVVRRRAVGPALLNALTVDAVIDPSYSGVPEALHAARRGDRRPLRDLLARLRPDPTTPPDALSQGLHASALCADSPLPWGGTDAPVAVRAAALRRAAARIPSRAIWPFDRATIVGNGFVKTCLWWPPTPAPPRPARRLPPVPTLLLAGDRDLSTPLEWAREEAALAPDAKLVVVPRAGHSVQVRAQSRGGRAAVRRFLHPR
jgi:pimeloyl-ACP methyl ester carboxylesterase